MLRMPPFKVLHPETVEEAVALHGQHQGSRYIAGGTDIIPNLKLGLLFPDHLISLGKLNSLKGISLQQNGDILIGAGVTLHELNQHPDVLKALPGLAQAAGAVAGPQHRRMGTVGGNIMLDTRCLYYNQTPQWRHSLGYCLKAEGDWCHVIGSKATCVAANSSDTVPMFLALNAVLEIVTAEGPSQLPLSSLYVQNGMANHTIDPSALVTGLRVPAQAAGHRSIYRKVRSRDAIDFPQLGLALVATFDGATCKDLVGVINAVMPKPKALKKLDFAKETALEDETIETLAEFAYKQTRPQHSIHGDTAWRRHMARIEMKRGLRALRDDPRTQAH